MESVLKILLHIRYANERLGNIVLGILYPIVFPFFVYIYRKNKVKERDTAVYPIINHFYHATLVNYVLITGYLTLTYSTLFFILPYKPELVPIILRILSVYSDYYAVFFNVHHLILSLLAIQRFLLYFFPKVEKYVNLKGKSIYVTIYGLYFVFYLKISVIYVAYFFIWEEQGIHEFFANMSLFDEVMTHTLLLSSTLLYIPIILSIRKSRHLASVQKNKPHQYILWQSMLIFIVKTIAIFPIINHFYRTICFFYIYISIYYCFDWFKTFTNNRFPTVIYWIDTAVSYAVSETYYAFFDVHEIILSLLAVQKFLIYFYPSIESKISYKGKGINLILLLVYAAYYAKIGLVHMVFIDKYDDYTQFYVIEHLILSGITSAPASLYIPILQHIKKHSHLQSVMKKKPDRYILMQTYLLVVTQFMTILHYLLLHLHMNKDGVTFDSIDIRTIHAYKAVSIPVLIQVSYLVSNQNNMKKLMKIKLLRRMLCFKKEARIEPLRLNNNVNTTLAS